ncbi:MAG TPA: class I SAM-dependent methyltransferase [Candidatus Omnitrophota bacterium]|nr:class I SAM-dependent methyltransferase [Candidatus Omnitrophota bacterium]
MDEYTVKTKQWLNERFARCNEEGIYYAHQPIYGLRKGYSEIRPINRHIITYHIMRVLSHLQFSSLVDIGGAEGFKAWVAKQLFNVKVVNTDLSEEACKRSREIFNIDSIPVDIHQLPFKTGEFDVVLCSETIEHVSDLRIATQELLRIAGRAAVITVPHEDREVVDRVIREKIAHGHLHHFDVDTFDYLKPEGYRVITEKMISPFLKKFSIYRLGKAAASLQIRVHDLFCRITPNFEGIIFVVLRQPEFWVKRARVNISPRHILDLTVPQII